MDTRASELEGLDGVIPANQARSREAQARLLKAGEQVFARKGYDDAHVSDIAQAANCSVGSFYRRFRDKEALFRALHVHFAQRMRENFERFFTMPQWRKAPTFEVLATLVDNTARVIERNPGFFRALFQRALAGAGASYLPPLRAADEHKGRQLAAFLRARGECASYGERLDDACILGLRTVESALIHRSLIGRPGEIRQASTIEALTRMLAGYLSVREP